MKRLLIVGMVLAVASLAFAGGNPDVQIYVSFDQSGAGGLEHSYTMTPGEPFNAYICVTELDMGLTGVSFALTDPDAENPGMFLIQSFVNDLDVAVGDFDTGISLASQTCRTEEVVVVAHFVLFPLTAGDFCIEIKDYPAFPRWVVDCTQPDGLVDFYCVFQNGTIGAGVCPVGDCPDPVEDSTWGGIKALYR
jgi:hypothetical protein